MTVDELIAEWWGKPGGQEKSNFAAFIPHLCSVLDVATPGPIEKGAIGAYGYEASVPRGSFRSLKGTGAIDLYKRGHFIMEAKQSYLKPEQAQLDLSPDEAAPRAPSGAHYDKLMRDARLQAENYAKNLPAGEPVCPFLIVCDVGRAFELYVDTAGNGRGYKFFPDKQSYRIELPQLANDAEVGSTGKTALELLHAIWTAPRTVDPRHLSADVTRTVAANLASVSKYLEEGIRIRVPAGRERQEEVEEASLFLMRVLFCMFAEDIGLLPEDRFKQFLKRAEANDDLFRNGLADLFKKMNSADPANRFAHAVEANVRYFNGRLFENNRTYPLGGFVIHDLYEAARQNWRKVEPAIFGTLLEQALNPEERAKLGAHYTPRPYVELLVRATIMDVLEPEWEAIEELPEADILAAATSFHAKLGQTRVLDPACGTGNFLYVAMELMQELEARVIERIQTLGGEAEPKVGPHQFHGLELNPRAAKIAELVLWIGWLRNRLDADPDNVPEPVLKESASINFGKPGGYDAVLKRGEWGEVDTRDPAQPRWPEAEFIVGNPPFIGKGSAMRAYLGDEYVDALLLANPRVAASSDFVMQWWDRAAHTLVANDSVLQRFGFVTTNSITQDFSRRVIAGYLSSPLQDGEGDHAEHGGGVDLPAPAADPSTASGGPPPPASRGEDRLSLILAIPDHPWTKATSDAAAVRIAMTVAVRGSVEGALQEVTAETKLDTDSPEVMLASVEGRINPDLSVGADVTTTKVLSANEGLACNGMMLAGQGFKVLPKKAKELATEERRDVSAVLKGYIGGGELLRGSSEFSVIDFCGLSEKQARQSYPVLYEHVYREVKPQRDSNRRKSLKEKWWIFAEPRKTFRSALEALDRYIGTTETSKHRVFQFISTDVLPDHMVVAIGSDSAFHLGVLQSSIHVAYALRAGGWLGVGNDSRYSKSRVFDPFPFPDANDIQRATIAELAEELDATRRAALAEVNRLTMTELYNLREKLRAHASGGEPLGDKDQRRASAARAGIVDRLHEQLDAAVADAYGWGEEWRSGALGPSEIVARLVALNHARAAEEAQGHVRWLRPDYQIPRFAPKEANE